MRLEFLVSKLPYQIDSRLMFEEFLDTEFSALPSAIFLPVATSLLLNVDMAQSTRILESARLSAELQSSLLAGSVSRTTVLPSP